MPTIEELIPLEVSRFLDEHLIDRSQRMAVAFSGGSDSLALLLALTSLLEASSLVPIYVDHALRPSEELAVELELNSRNCSLLGLDLTVLHLGHGSVGETARLRGTGIEEAARTLRYTRLEESCRQLGCTYLATAHNADDQVETILKRVFQGSSIASLEGIIPMQRGFFTETTILRPVLQLTHGQLQQYVQKRGYQWSEDSTNGMECFERNAIRKNLTPAILSLYPQAYKAVTRLTERARDVSHLLDGLARAALQQVAFSDDAALCLEAFLAMDPAIRDTVLMHMFNHVLEDPSVRLPYARVQQVRLALEASTSESRWRLSSGGTIASLDRGWFSLQAEKVFYSFCSPLTGLGPVDIGPDASFSVLEKSDDPLLIRIEEGMLDHPLVRSPLEGDQIALQGKTVLLSKLFSEWKIPLGLQSQIPVLEDASGIVAVFGRFLGGRDRLCARYKTPLARRRTNIYSVNKRNECRET